MSKAILVIDMPSSCSKCRLKTAWFNSGGGITIGRKYYGMMVGCKLKGDCGQMFNAKGRPAWCPLKPLPKIKEERLEYLHYLGADVRELHCYEIGHDDCLDEILGEDE